MKKRVGLIGAGLMGQPMGLNWIKNDFELSVLPRSQKPEIAELQNRGAQICTSHEELVKKSDVVVLMLPTSREVESTTEALLSYVTPKHFVIDMTTSEPSSTEGIFKKFHAQKLKFFDAPVTGGVFGAKAGTLTLFLGGDPAWHEEVDPVFGAISKVRSRFGDVGAGHKAKVINNLICIGNLAVYAEALPFAVKMGLDPEQMFSTLMTGTGASRMLELYGEQILSGDFAPRFKLGHAYKDLLIAVDIAKKEKLSFPVLDGVLKLFEKAMAQNLGEENIASLIKPVESALSSPFRRP